MNKVIIGLALCLACSSAFAQSAILYDYVAGDNFSFGGLANDQIRVYSVLKTNISTGEKEGYLALITYDGSRLTTMGEGHFTLDEIPAVIEMLNYAQDNLVDSTPKTEPQLEFVSLDDCRLGIRFNKAGRSSWLLYCEPEKLSTRRASIPANNIPKLLLSIKESEAIIKEHLSSN